LEDPFIFSIFATNNAKFEMSPGKIGTVPIFQDIEGKVSINVIFADEGAACGDLSVK
jgi:hypothetical protein